MNKLSPKNVKICPGCPKTDLNLDVTPQFKFINTPQTDSKKINIFTNTKQHIKSKLQSLF